jgi:hypothetical protein
MKRSLLIITGSFILIAISLVLYAFLNTRGKTDLLIRIHINKQLVQQSGFGEAPTFAIWLENPQNHEIHTVYVTRRAAEGDWEGKAEVPVALPRWFEIQKDESKSGQRKADSYSGATPKPGYFTAKASLMPGSRWICWIEVNLAGDFNEFYPGNIHEENDADKYLSGQPAILFRAEITSKIGEIINPSVVGMTLLGAADGKIIQPLNGITDATGIFDEIAITIEKPKPKIFNHGVSRSFHGVTL